MRYLLKTRAFNHYHVTSTPEIETAKLFRPSYKHNSYKVGALDWTLCKHAPLEDSVHTFVSMGGLRAIHPVSAMHP